jgi:mannose-6-phosphate isomerase-like protein (cupin superfamily)
MVKPLTTRPENTSRVTWREGVETRLHPGGAETLCLMEQWCAPGTGAPTHTHFDVEEVIAVLDGAAEFWVDDAAELIGPGESIVLPAYSHHGFRNAGREELHTLAVFASAHPLVEYDHDPGAVYEIDSHLRNRHEGQE